MSDSPELRDEIERLRAANAALERRVARRVRARGAGSAFLLVLGCGLAALSVVAIWLRVTLLDTDHYVKTVAPIAAQPSVQRAVAAKINTAIDQRFDVEPLIRQALPGRADVLAPAITSGFETLIHARVNAFTASPKFQQLWTEANRRAHVRLVALLTGGQSKNLLLRDDTVYLDLSGVVDQVRAGLRARGLGTLAGVIPSGVGGEIPLIQSSAIPKAQGTIRLLKAMAILFPLIALLCLAGSILLARRWQYGLLRVGLGLALAMLLLIAALGIGRSAYLSAISQAVLPRDAASAIFDTTAAFLRHAVRIVAVASVVVAAVAFVLSQPLGRLWNTGLTRIAEGPWAIWIAGHERWLLLAVGGAGALVMFAWNPLTVAVVVIDVLIVAAVMAVIAGIGARARPPADLVAPSHPM